jgi:hypothetical protein
MRKSKNNRAYFYPVRDNSGCIIRFELCRVIQQFAGIALINTHGKFKFIKSRELA